MQDDSSAPTGASAATAASSPSDLASRLAARIAQAGGWLAFDEFMAAALYSPGLGYYSGGRRIFGIDPRGGSDFVTAPELSPLFGRVLAVQVEEALRASGTCEVIEFGAGSGALAEQLLQALPAAIDGEPLRYAIVELSGALRERQQARLAGFAPRVRWLDAWPEAIRGVVVGNEVLDAMPVKLLARGARAWHERGVALDAAGRFAFADRAEPLQLAGATRAAEALDAWAGPPGSVTEIHPQAEAFIESLAARLVQGAALLIDYGFPEHEYYHPQRTGGTLMCHRGHRADGDPLADVGEKDITAHVNFSGIALAAQSAGLEIAGYTSQARFLLNCGLGELLAAASTAERAMAQRLVNEHEMGELFKVIALSRGSTLDPLGFRAGDRTHRL